VDHFVEGEQMETRQSPNATLQQAAAYLRVSERSVQNYQDRGLLKPVRFGKRRFFRWSELQKLAKNGVPPAPNRMQSNE